MVVVVVSEIYAFSVGGNRTVTVLERERERKRVK